MPLPKIAKAAIEAAEAKSVTPAEDVIAQPATTTETAEPLDNEELEDLEGHDEEDDDEEEEDEAPVVAAAKAAPVVAAKPAAAPATVTVLGDAFAAPANPQITLPQGLVIGEVVKPTTAAEKPTDTPTELKPAPDPLPPAVVDAAAVADAIMANPEHVNVLAEIAVRRIKPDVMAQLKPVTATAVPAPPTPPAPAPAPTVVETNTTTVVKSKRSWGWLLHVVIALVVISLMWWGYSELFAGRDGSTTTTETPFTDPVQDDAPTPRPVAAPIATAPDASQVMSCVSQLDLARAPFDAAERVRLNCGHDVVCRHEGIDFAAREFTSDGERFIDLAPDPDGDIDAERHGCSL